MYFVTENPFLFEIWLLKNEAESYIHVGVYT